MRIFAERLAPFSLLLCAAIAVAQIAYAIGYVFGATDPYNTNSPEVIDVLSGLDLAHLDPGAPVIIINEQTGRWAQYSWDGSAFTLVNYSDGNYAGGGGYGDNSGNGGGGNGSPGGGGAGGGGFGQSCSAIINGVETNCILG